MRACARLGRVMAEGNPRAIFQKIWDSHAVAAAYMSANMQAAASRPSDLRPLCATSSGVEPHANVRDRISVERFVEALRYVADVRRRQYVVESPKGVRRRQRLNIEHIDGRPGDLPLL
jgi:hypothetical protein